MPASTSQRSPALALGGVAGEQAGASRRVAMSASLSWMAWCSAMGLPKVSAAGVGERGVEGGPGHADGPCRDVDPAHLEHAEDLGQAAPELTDEVGGGDAVVGVGHLDRLDAPVAELAHVLADRDALEARPGLLLDDEGGDALLGAGGQRHDGGALAVGDPGLGAVEDVLVAVALALQEMLRVSLPASGSESESAPRRSPEAMAGSQRCFCSSLPCVMINVAAMVWVLTMPVRLIQP
jgi:hypothetical protein